MIVLLEKDSTALQRTLAAHPCTCRVAAGWRDLESLVPGALCTVVLLEWLDGGDGMEGLARLQRRFPCHPVVLVTRGSMENARHLRRAAVEEVVWLESVAATLWDAVTRAVASGARNGLATALAGARHLPRTLREALVHACVAGRPVYSVSDLAAQVHCDRTTLCLQWRKAVGSSTSLRLIDFLALVLLLHSVQLRLMGRKTPDVAAELGVHEHTLRRLTRRLAGEEARPTPEALQLLLTARLEDLIHRCILGSSATAAAASGEPLLAPVPLAS